MSRTIYFFANLLFIYLGFAYAQGLSLHGIALLKPNEAPSYVNKNAPKGGKLVTGVLGSFDSVNPFNLKGVAGPEIRHFTVESLMKRHMDEPFTLYPSLAGEYLLGEKQVSFTLNKAARFSDDTPVTIADVVYSYEILRSQGRPNYRTFYNKVKSIEAKNNRITFFLNEDDRELPLIIALMPIFKAGQFTQESFAETTTKPIVASGAYVITEVKPGERLTLIRNKNWWAKDLPLNIGQQNFDELRFDFYRDQTALLEAFKRGLVDWRLETDPKRWRELKSGNQNYHEIKTEMPLPFRAYFFNTRKELLANKQVREALIRLFDGEYINNQLYEGAYTRLLSPFFGSELAGQKSVEKLGERENLRKALKLLHESGFLLKNGLLTNDKGDILTLEIIVNSRDKERLAKMVATQFSKAGITLNIRLLDNVQYEFRLRNFDFDLIDTTLTNSLSPGHEQAFYWGSMAAENIGSRNYSGLKNKEIDFLITQLTVANSREEIIKTTRQLDLAIMEQAVTLPLFQPSKQYIALHRGVKMPEKQSIYGYLPETWWRE